MSKLNFNNFVLWVKTHYKIILLFFVFFLLGGIFYYYWTLSYLVSQIQMLKHFMTLHHYMVAMGMELNNVEHFPKLETCSDLYKIPELKQVLINQPGTDTITTGVHLNKSYIQHCPNKESADSLAISIDSWPTNILAAKHLKTNCYCMEVHDMFRQTIDSMSERHFAKKN